MTQPCFKSFSCLTTALVLSCLFPQLKASAFTFSWGSNTYTAGSLGPVTYTNVNGSGVDLTVKVTGATSGLIEHNGTGSGYSPIIDNDYSSRSLDFTMNQADKANIINIEFSFSKPLSSVATTILDVDQSPDNTSTPSVYDDQVSIIGSLSGTNKKPTLTAVNPLYVSVDNVATTPLAYGIRLASNTGTNGNVGVAFLTQKIDKFTINYGNNTSRLSVTDPGQQGIGIGNISFVPFEFSPSQGLLLVGGFWGFSYWRSRRKNGVDRAREFLK